jgi:8-oxo-dGTP diphosphatase
MRRTTKVKAIRIHENGSRSERGILPEATVAAIITPPDGDTSRILLTRRGGEPFRGQWCLPGGHIDRYEAARDAIIREVQEETGLDFEPCFFRYFDERVSARDIHSVVLVFTGCGTGVLRAQKGEVSEIGWFSTDEAQSLPLAFTHNEILDASAARTRSG